MPLVAGWNVGPCISMEITTPSLPASSLLATQLPLADWLSPTLALASMGQEVFNLYVGVEYYLRHACAGVARHVCVGSAC